ncbi:MAG: L-fucose/L-arabinose isomerase family protein [Candidatus Hydrogenedentes bacterium]|nr:L-fucose/L-arabinose isomerase family protein [Candidatus Hydrogenedentota bacterium]
MKVKNSLTFGVIVGNRAFFPDVLAKEGHSAIVKLLQKCGFGVVILSDSDTKCGAVETWEDAKKCADLFKKHKDEIDGVIVTLPNFGDEKAVADTLRLANLKVPVLIHAFPDDPNRMAVERRRDSFCGKISVCANLNQYRIPFTLTTFHTEPLESKEFLEDLRSFAGTCRVIKGLKNCRVGAMGARPSAFNTVRFSEKLLENYGISVETIDLSEILGEAEKLSVDSGDVKGKLKDISEYILTKGVPPKALEKMAKFFVVTERWIEEKELDTIAIQCWTALEKYFGVVPCTCMSMLSERLIPSACEVDVCGAISMYSLTLASGKPSALLDWNNNFKNEPEKCIMFHCSNLPKSFFSKPTMDYQAIIAESVGKENTYGTVTGQIKPSSMTFARMGTREDLAEIQAYVGEGEFTKDKVNTFGGFGVAKIPNLQSLMHFICINGFEHHVAVTLDSVGQSVYEAWEKYLNWDVYYHPNLS